MKNRLEVLLQQSDHAVYYPNKVSEVNILPEFQYFWLVLWIFFLSVQVDRSVYWINRRHQESKAVLTLSGLQKKVYRSCY